MEYNPISVVLKIKKIEYRYLLLPFILIIGTFVAVKFYGIVQIKYLSILALFLYFFVKMLFRINKIASSEIGESEKTIKSPVSGKVVKIENNTITIYKNLFDRADLRAINSDYTIQKGKVFLIEKSNTQSVLTGVIPMTALCNVKLTDNCTINVKIGQKIISGITDLGSYDE